VEKNLIKSTQNRQPFKSIDSNAFKTKNDEVEKAKTVHSKAIRSGSSKIIDSFGGTSSKKACLSESRITTSSTKTKKTTNAKFTIFSDMEKNGDMSRPLPSRSDKPFDDMTNDVANLKLSKTHQDEVAPTKKQTMESLDFGKVSVMGKTGQVPNPIITRDGAYNHIENVMQNACGSKTSDVLETMHSRLEKSFNAKEQGDLMCEDLPTIQKTECSPVWVSRYVDYTSKYGLGFILNDGSSGVYFNDSTKIVLAPDGDFFQYIERRKAIPNQKESHQEIEPTIHIYSLTSYPEHLQKKVTLLQHFRNYLIEQQKTSGESEQPKIVSPRKKADTENSANSISPYVYLKKWVRTRHAILFRLSNCTVQVVFYDHTEVLLSSEARLVTYVDKSGKRTTFPIQEITKNPNGEVGKRLKYAKDILQQLISGGK